MNYCRTVPVTLSVFVLLVSLVGVSASAATGVEKQWDFKVYLDDKEIGFHKVRLIEKENEKQVDVEASFDVKVLFITAYAYRHKTQEVWKGGCLSEIESTTDDNGEALFLKSQTTDKNFFLQTHDGEQEIPGCVRSFAYWNPELLVSDQLLNTQSGEYESVQLQKLGESSLAFSDKQLTGMHYRLLLEDGAIDLWYSPDNLDWLALQSELSGGRQLRYIRSEQVL